MSQGHIEARPWSLARAPAAAWIGLAALAALGWREGLAFAASSEGASNVEQMFFDAADNPPWVISVVAAALLVSRWRDLRAALGPPGSPARASLLLAPGLALLGWGRFVQAGELALLGTIAMALGAAYAAGGARLLRLLAVPLGLLAFAVPAPGALVNQIVYPLQLWTADYAFALLQPLQVSALHSADVIQTPSHKFLVIEGCSGLGSMEVLTLLALAWAWQTRNTFAQGLVLVLAAPPIAFALNGFRVVSLVLFPDSGFWSDHTTQGVVAFALGALAIALLDRVVARRRPDEEEGAAEAPRGKAGARPPVGLALWLGAAALASVLVPIYAARSTTGPDVLLPASLPGWAGSELEVDHLFLGSVRFDRTAHRLYAAEAPPPGTSAAGEPVSVAAFVGENIRTLRGSSVLSPKNLLPGRGWQIEERAAAGLPGPIPAERAAVRSEARRRLTYLWYADVDAPALEAAREFLGLDRSPFGRQHPTYAIRLSTELQAGDAGRRQAERRILAVLRLLRSDLSALAPRRG